MTNVITATASDIVTAALRLIGEVDANEAVSAAEMDDGLEALNYLVKSYQAQGLHLWTKTEGILFLDVGKTDYLLGPSGDEATNEDDFIRTELSVAGVSTNGTITVDSSAGMAVSDKIGVLLDDGTRQWTTIKSLSALTPLVITLTTALTGAAAIDNSVFTYTTQLPRPLRILQVRRGNADSSTDDIESHQWSRAEYFAQPGKSDTGDLVNWYYSPQLTDGRIYVWQASNDADKVARFTYERPIDITDDTTDNADFPSEWFRTLKYNLAADIAPEYTIPMGRLDRITAKAERLLEDSLGFDAESYSLQMQPDFG
jgi:hypothetical protein